MGKGSSLGGLKNAGAWPGYTRARRCIGCHHPIVYGERCPPCATLVRTRAAKRRRRR